MKCVYSKLLDERETSWHDSKECALDLLREVSHFFTGPWVRKIFHYLCFYIYKVFLYLCFHYLGRFSMSGERRAGECRPPARAPLAKGLHRRGLSRTMDEVRRGRKGERRSLPATGPHRREISRAADEAWSGNEDDDFRRGSAKYGARDPPTKAPHREGLSPAGDGFRRERKGERRSAWRSPAWSPPAKGLHRRGCFSNREGASWQSLGGGGTLDRTPPNGNDNRSRIPTLRDKFQAAEAGTPPSSCT